ncbi:MAG TPA: hypothetical protein VMT67_05055, partial [Terriglobales bacterium]|nr:hypothetical protein [Terriglobales bacterium]
VRVLLQRKAIILAHPCSYEGRNEHGRARWKHQAKSDGLKKRARIVKRSHGVPVKAPLRRSCLLELLFSHSLD